MELTNLEINNSKKFHLPFIKSWMVMHLPRLTNILSLKTERMLPRGSINIATWKLCTILSRFHGN